MSDINNFFFSEVIRGIEDNFISADYSLIVCNTNEVLERETQALDMLLRQRVDGIIAAATSHDWDILTEVEKQHMPIVLLDRTFENAHWPYVGVNNEQGAYLGTKHLIECGHQQIGILAGLQRLTTMQERLAGFRRAMLEFALPINEDWIITTPLSVEAAQEAALKLLAQAAQPSALFINNNLLSLSTLMAIRELGLRCPDDIALLGFDDHPWAAVANPPLTVVKQPTWSLGQVASEIVLDLIHGEEPQASSVVLQCELVIRESCGHHLK